MKAMKVIKGGLEKIEATALELVHGARGRNRNRRGLSTVETIALTVVVVGAVVGMAAVLNPKLNDLMTRAFDTIATNLGI